MSNERCTPDKCQYHLLHESVVNDLKEAVHKLMDGQEQMRLTIVQLTESFKAIDRIDQRLEKLEDIQRKKDKYQDDEIRELQKRLENKNDSQDVKIDELRGFMWKLMGAFSVISVAAPYILKAILVGLL